MATEEEVIEEDTRKTREIWRVGPDKITMTGATEEVRIKYLMQKYF